MVENDNKIAEILRSLDPNDSKSLQMAVITAIKVRNAQKSLSEYIGVSRISLNRWAKGDNIPKSIAYREFLIGKTADFISSGRMNGNTPSSPAIALKHQPRKSAPQRSTKAATRAKLG
jgi:hypothetical protein